MARKKKDENENVPGTAGAGESQNKPVAELPPGPVDHSRKRKAPQGDKVTVYEKKETESGGEYVAISGTEPASVPAAGSQSAENVTGPGARTDVHNTFWEGSGAVVRNRMSAVGDIADLFYRSGFFPDLSPSQIAVMILAGDELGFKPVATMYQLKLAPGNIELTDTFLRILDTVEAVEQAQHRIVTKPPTGRQAAANAMRAGIDRKNKADAAALAAPKTEKVSEQAPAAETGTAAASAASDNVVNIRPLPETGSTPDPRPTFGEEMAAILADEPAPDDPDAEFAARVGPATPPVALTAGEPENEYKGFDDAMRAAVPSYVPPGPVSLEDQVAAMAEIPDPDKPIGTGDDAVRACKIWRNEIERMTTELSIDMAAIKPAEKLATYDGKDVTEKAKLFATIRKYYDDQVEKYRAQVLEGFEKKSWTIIDNWRGFCVFVGTNSNPIEWSYTEAAKLRGELIREGTLQLPN